MIRNVALLIFPGVQSLDVSGPLDVFAEANRFLAPEDHYRLEVVGTAADWLACSNGLPVRAHRHYSAHDAPLDLLLVPGGPALPGQDFEADLYAWLRVASARARRFASVCNGAFLLARAGLLDGRTVTTHWNDVAALAAVVPTAHIEGDRIYVEDGPLYTSAGVTAGIDLSLHLLSLDHGAEIALNVAKRLVVFMQRAGGQSQFSPYLTPYVSHTSPIAQVQHYVLNHLAQDLGVETLARVANMSHRNFFRAFARDTRTTPADFVESVRVDAARSRLESGAAPLKTIAYECGFRDPHHMRAVFKRRLGVSPGQYRSHFGTPAR
jgi:transcriptional regulator GlxA family with amidase domain